MHLSVGYQSRTELFNLLVDGNCRISGRKRSVACFCSFSLSFSRPFEAKLFVICNSLTEKCVVRCGSELQQSLAALSTLAIQPGCDQFRVKCSQSNHPSCAFDPHYSHAPAGLGLITHRRAVCPLSSPKSGGPCRRRVPSGAKWASKEQTLRPNILLRTSAFTYIDTHVTAKGVKHRIILARGINRSFVRGRQRLISTILLETAERPAVLPSGKHPAWSILVQDVLRQAKPYSAARYS
ncbi:hypothetical protein BU25DRAFT_414222, partial [Macroventuria anomochaeta]